MKVRRLLGGLKKVRKRAGKVRDMDVLTGHAITVNPSGEQDCLVQLMEYLGAERKQYASKLRRVVKEDGRGLRRDLKRNRKRVIKLLKQEKDGSADSKAVSLTMAKAVQLSAELNSPARLSKSNLHRYRLKVKELRDVLLLSAQAGDEEFLRTLEEVKDAIGEWHDWEELISIAMKLLNHGARCKLIKHLRTISDSKYERALFLTRHLRSNYLQPRNQPGPGHEGPGTLSAPVISVVSAVAHD
jgi:CHAD domain-containing protein